MNPDSALFQASTWVVPVIMAVTFHEASHGFVAYRFGDTTAWEAGRVTFNPLKHIDPFGTVVLPAMLFLTAGFLFGYAKPVPVDFRRLHNPRRDMVWVALAGPMTNVLLAIASSLLLYAVEAMPVGTAALWLVANLENSIAINAVLCVFNMLPLPPLDGGRVAVGLLPLPLARPLASLERYGMLIVLLLFVVSYAGRGSGLNILSWLVFIPAEALIDFVQTITGQNG
ncbi:MAG: site-2 protease family protein [Alphaproteobacteria bacterium]|nr:site-2 protease family protein [Alphaproteobacteria bacterium]